MGIKYYDKERIWKLDTKASSYIIGVVDEEAFVGHIYYGKKVDQHDLEYLMRIDEPPFVPSKNNRDRVSFYDSFPMEYPTHGLGDYRETSLQVRTKDGHTACQLRYISHEIIKGKPELTGLPSTFGSEEECTTLNIICKDIILDLEVTLVYTVFENIDAITRNVRIKNCSQDKINITKAYSCSVDFDGMDYDVITMHGSWARERHVQRKSIGYGKQSTSSIRGESGHQDHPFLALLKKDATEDFGEVYGFNFVYSGNFIAQAEGTQFDAVRVVMGIHTTDFDWGLLADQEFITPEVVMVYSDEGLGKMSRTFHDLYRNNLIRGKYKDTKRPILINNWEATYFDFDTDKLLSIAKEAAGLGIEMLVMDDGWFGYRNSDNSSLGDWVVNEGKIKGGLKNLVDKVNEIGLEFGIWFEPKWYHQIQIFTDSILIGQ